MRVSTAQFYYQNAQQLGSLQSKVNEQAAHLDANKRILTAKDDAVAFGTLTGMKNESDNIEKYQRNINQAVNRNSLQHVSFETAEEIMQQLKQTFIQANNGTLSDDDLASLAGLAQNSLEQLLDVANTTDETGGYIFSGYQVDTTPFVIQADNTVTYKGDSGIRELQVAKNVTVDLNQAGDAAFESVANNQGDFSAQYNTNTSGISLNRATISNPSAYDSVSNPPDYNFQFSGPLGAEDLNVFDSLGNNVFSSSPYVPGQTIAFNGVEVTLSGNPLPGDDFDLTPAESISIFDTIQGAIDWMNVGSSATNPAQHSVDYNELLGQLDQALNHMTTGIVEAGVRLKLLDNQQSNHLDSALYLDKGIASIEGLDFAKTASDYEQAKVSLQVAQQTFVQIKDLSLFNYI